MDKSVKPKLPIQQQFEYQSLQEGQISRCELQIDENQANLTDRKIHFMKINCTLDVFKKYAIYILVLTVLSVILFLFMFIFWSFEKPSNNNNYKNHKVIKLMPTNIEQLKEIIHIEKRYDVTSSVYSCS